MYKQIIYLNRQCLKSRVLTEKSKSFHTLTENIVSTFHFVFNNFISEPTVLLIDDWDILRIQMRFRRVLCYTTFSRSFILISFGENTHLDNIKHCIPNIELSSDTSGARACIRFIKSQSKQRLPAEAKLNPRE